MNTTCKNCARDLQPDYAFCPSCSQKADLHRLSFHEVTHEGIHYFTHADKGIFTLLRDLAIRGGTVAREFIDGRRKTHFPPLNFFLITAALNLLIVNLDGLMSVGPIEQMYPNIATTTDAAKVKMYHQVYESQVTFMTFMSKYANIAAIANLPLITWVFWLFYKRSGYNFVEHLFAGMYMYGFTLLFSVVTAAISHFLGLNVNFYYLTSILFQLIYMSIFYKQMLPGFRKRRAVAASLCAMLLSFFLWGVIGIVYAIVTVNS